MATGELDLLEHSELEQPKLESAEIMVKTYPVDRVKLEDNSARTFEVVKPPKLDIETIVSVTRTIEDSEVKSLVTMEVPKEPNPSLIQKVHELTAVRYAEALVAKEKGSSSDLNMEGALNSHTKSLEGFPKGATADALRYMEGAIQGLDQILIDNDIPDDVRETIIDQAEMVVVKACSDRMINEGPVSPNEVYKWPSDTDGREILLTAESLHGMKPDAKGVQATVQRQLGMMAVSMLRAVKSYNSEADEPVADEISPRAAQMTRLILNENYYSQIEEGAKVFNEDLLEGSERHPKYLFDGTKGIKRVTKLTPTGDVYSDIENIDADTFRENFVLGFTQTCIKGTKFQMDREFQRQFVELSRSRIEKQLTATADVLGTYTQMAHNFEDRHLGADDFGKYVGNVSDEDCMRLFIAAMGKEAAETIDPTFRFSVEASVNQIPGADDDLERAHAFNFAQSVEMLRQTTNDYYRETPGQVKSEQLKEQQAKELSYALINAAYCLHKCDATGEPTIPRLKTKDELWDPGDLAKLPTKAKKS